MTTTTLQNRSSEQIDKNRSLRSPTKYHNEWSIWPRTFTMPNRGPGLDEQARSLHSPEASSILNSPDSTSTPSGKSTNHARANPDLAPKSRTSKPANRTRIRTRNSGHSTTAQRIDSKREKNRIAASKCRAKKQVGEKQLESQAKLLQSDNMRLSMELDMLRQAHLRLKEEIVRHGWNCRGCSRGLLDGMAAELSPESQTPAVRLPELSDQQRYRDEDGIFGESRGMGEFFRDGSEAWRPGSMFGCLNEQVLRSDVESF